MARNQIGRPKNYPILSNDKYREGWERVFGKRECMAGDCTETATQLLGLEYVNPPRQGERIAVPVCPKHGAKR